MQLFPASHQYIFSSLILSQFVLEKVAVKAELAVCEAVAVPGESETKSQVSFCLLKCFISYCGVIKVTLQVFNLKCTI